MKPIQLEKVLPASLNRAYRLALDIENTPAIFPQIVRIQMLDAPKDAAGLCDVGTRWIETRKGPGGRQVSVELMLTDRKVNESFVVSANVMNARFDTQFAFSAIDARCTMLRLSALVTTQRFLAKLLSPLMRSTFRKGLAEDLDSLARAATNLA